MRRYTLSIGDRTFTIDVEETAADRFEVSVDGRRFEASLHGDEDLPGVVITPGPAAADAHAAAHPAAHPSPPSADLSPAAARSPLAPLPESSAAPRRPPAASLRRPVDVVTAPMPGVVLDVLVTAGRPIRRGDPLLVLEAMKMRNTIRSPRDAVVVEVPVEAGLPVAPGDPLVRLKEPDG